VANRDAIGGNAGRVPPALIGSVVLGAIVVIFIFQNTHRVPIRFLWFERDAQLWLMLLITAAISIAAAELFTAYLRHRRD
jgi:uncharacterized integral membrane protein